ncbi:hypothetical protein HanPSC8_Chr05g0203991 [Helianthus annuus]|nr:hypothetical protein HanPSC8_Chr05g0203991 [Helianthus annuus]
MAVAPPLTTAAVENRRWWCVSDKLRLVNLVCYFVSFYSDPLERVHSKIYVLCFFFPMLIVMSVRMPTLWWPTAAGAATTITTGSGGGYSSTFDVGFLVRAGL